MRFFLDNNYDRTLHVLSILNNNSTMTINEISKKTEYSIPTIRKIINELESVKFSNKNNLLVIRKNKNISGVTVKNYPLAAIAVYYLEKSILFLMIKELLDKNEIVTTDFCLEYGICKSGFSLYRSKLRQFLMSIQLDLNSKNQITGKEALIRTFFILFFYNSHTKWTFGNYSGIKHSASRIFNEWESYKSTEKNFLCTILYVSRKRIEHKKFLKNVDSEYEFYKPVHTINEKSVEKYLNIKSNTKSETIFFMLQLRRENLVCNSNDKLELNSLLIKDKHLYFVSKSIAYALKTIGNLDLPVTVIEDIITMNTIIFYLYIPYHPFYYIYEDKNFYHLDNAEMNLFNKIKRVIAIELKKQEVAVFYKKFLQLFGFEELVYCFFILIYGKYSKNIHKKKTVLSIYIEHSKPMHISIIKEKLVSIFTDNIKFIDTNKHKADLILTDYPIKLAKNNILHISSFSDKKDFNLILLTIMNMLNDR